MSTGKFPPVNRTSLRYQESADALPRVSTLWEFVLSFEIVYRAQRRLLSPRPFGLYRLFSPTQAQSDARWAGIKLGSIHPRKVGKRASCLFLFRRSTRQQERKLVVLPLKDARHISVLPYGGHDTE